MPERQEQTRLARRLISLMLLLYQHCRSGENRSAVLLRRARLAFSPRGVHIDLTREKVTSHTKLVVQERHARPPERVRQRLLPHERQPRARQLLPQPPVHILVRGRNETCPLSTEGGTRRVQLVRDETCPVSPHPGPTAPAQPPAVPPLVSGARCGAAHPPAALLRDEHAGRRLHGGGGGDEGGS
jgi:hypothetical protein